jgi:hypothetical protein
MSQVSSPTVFKDLFSDISQKHKTIKSKDEIIKKFKFTSDMGKTFIGKTTKGLDFLGYRFEGQKLLDGQEKRLKFLLTKSTVL